MADKKKMSVAEMIAAARKADSGAGEADDQPNKTDSSEAEAPAKVSQGSAPSKSVPKPGEAGRPSVAEMLAMARGEKSGAEKAAPKKAAEKKPAAKKPAAAKAATPSKPAEPRDTASILAAARKPSKAGPMSKAEAAAKEKANPKKEKPKIVVPPMPQKPAYAIAPPAPGKPGKKGAGEETRRGFLAEGFTFLGAALLLWTVATVKFMFPNVLREPPSKFKVGLPDEFPPGQVNTKYKAQFAVWISNGEYNGQQQIYALRSVCTHLGCTPNWLEAEQKFKCPCHGSGFYKDGVNFEGPAPRPLERYAIRVAGDGQIEIDKNQLFFEEKGEWDNPSCFIPV